MATKKRVVIVIPTYNECDNIGKLTEHLFNHIFPKIIDYDMHILVVDDTSPDGTADLVKKLQKKYKKLHLYLNKKKAGLGHAYIKGLNHAMTKLNADVMFKFDADFSHDPTKIPIMLEKIDGGFDMVVGSRYIPGGKIPGNWGLHRKFLSIVGNLVCRTLVTDFGIHDWTGGFRALKRKVVKSILPEMNRKEFSGYTFQIGFLLKARRKGYKVTEVPFHFKDRTAGKSKMPASYIQTTLKFIIRERIKEITNSRVFKFCVVGGIGALVQLTSLQLFRTILAFQISFFLSVEMAVISNFSLNNLWTFSDKKLAPNKIPSKFIQFNLASAGSIIIQQIIAILGQRFIGLFVLFTIFNINIDTGLIFAIAGIFAGLFWNYFAYSKFIWKNKS